MGLFHKIMTKLGRHRLIQDRRTGADYLHRYYLFLTDRTWFPFNITMHKIVLSDDPIFHDHPWSFTSIIIKGGYWEHLPLLNTRGQKIGEMSHWRGPGSIIRHEAEDMHWIELECEKPATTIVVMGRQKRDWGFLVEAKKGKHRWVKNEHYLNAWKPYHEKYITPRAASRKKQ